MNNSNQHLGANAPLEKYCQERKGRVSAYLLECRLRKVLDATEINLTDLHRATGLSRLELERAVYDRVYQLNANQLSQALATHASEGFPALVLYLHHSYGAEEVPHPHFLAA